MSSQSVGPTTFNKSYWAENWYRTWRDWEDRQALVGFALLVLALLGYGWIKDDPDMALIGVYVAGAYIALRIFVITPMAMWNDSRREINDFRDRLKPRMSFVFDPDNIPYLQQLPISNDGVELRIYRVGIKNDSLEIIRHVRVVVESVAFMLDGVACPPTTENTVPVEHALTVMALGSRDGMVDLAPGDRPTAYFDVAEQRVDRRRTPYEHFSLCYATGYRVELQLLRSWSVSLRVEGGGAYARQRFLISQEPEGWKLVMSPQSLG
ncbi:MAG: hypothetical protein JJE40_12095 [Vicinamibacteria bacterium]|nr:hypothetical protein [Vicinamibacteria bacterium]